MARPLFPDHPASSGPPAADAAAAAKAAPRLVRPDRERLRLMPLALDQLLPAEHPARLVWEFAEGVDLSALYAEIRSVEGRAGRAPIDPRTLLALWLFATLEGVGSARQIERLCKEHLAYIWLCGGTTVGHTVLAEFRVEHEAVLDRILAGSVATLVYQGLVKLERVAQDGVRVRASAGAASLHRKKTLEERFEEAKARIAALKAELDADPAASERRAASAKLRGAQRREKQVKEALRQLPHIQAVNERNQRKKGKRAARKAAKKAAAAKASSNTDKDEEAGTVAGATTAVADEPTPREARASSTDPDARVMKMPDGGYRPALNAQFATDVDTLVIVGVDVGEVGSDAGLHGPMITRVKRDFGVTPREWLVDGGFPTLASVEAMPDGCDIIAPLPPAKDASRDPHKRLPSDTGKVAAWRERMGSEAAKQTYRLRAATAECVNAQARNRGLQQFRVRGKPRARCVLLLHAIAHNLVRAASLRAKQAAAP